MEYLCDIQAHGYRHQNSCFNLKELDPNLTSEIESAGPAAHAATNTPLPQNVAKANAAVDALSATGPTPASASTPAAASTAATSTLTSTAAAPHVASTRDISAAKPPPHVSLGDQSVNFRKAYLTREGIKRFNIQVLLS